MTYVTEECGDRLNEFWEAKWFFENSNDAEVILHCGKVIIDCARELVCKFNMKKIPREWRVSYGGVRT